MSVDFITKCKEYDIICLCETRCDDTDMNNVKVDMETLGYDIVYKNKHILIRFKSGGLVIAVNKKRKLHWKTLCLKSDIFISILVDKVLGLDKM